MGKNNKRNKDRFSVRHDENSHDGLCPRRKNNREPSPEKTHISVADCAPLTDTQAAFDEAYYCNELTVGIGCAGTGKTYRAVYLALRDVFNPAMPQNKMIFVRSTVPVRDDGHLPGTSEEKAAPYERPLMAIVNELCGRDDAYALLKKHGVIAFHSTSHEQGLTYRESCVVLDEIQNFTFKELDLITTRRGPDCKMIAVGDSVQDYVTCRKEQSGLNDWLSVVDILQDDKYAAIIKFTEDDIIRDAFVKSYIKAKNKLLLAA